MCQIPKLGLTFGEPDKNCTSSLVSGPPSSLVFQKQSLLPTEILISPCLLESKTNVCVPSSTKYLYRPSHEKAIKDGGRFRKKFSVISIVYLDNALQCSFSVWEGAKISA